MFYFFRRKKFLIDYLEGLVDVHNHILPGIDDGAKTVDESIELIQGFSKLGIRDFIATPHIMHNYYPNTPETIRQSMVLLKDELLKRNMKDISIRTGAEHMIDENFESILEQDLIVPIKNRFLLIEMSFLQSSINFNESILKISSKNYSSILAHPERYVFLHGNFKKYRQYKEQGILFQLNLLSLSDFYGKEVQHTAIKLINNGFIDFVGTDVHNMNQLNSLKEAKVSLKMMENLIPIIEETNQTF